MNGGRGAQIQAPTRNTAPIPSPRRCSAPSAEKAGVPTQVFHNHSDILGGSTLGNLSTAQVSLNMVDIGLAQLAMHSPYETAGAKDTDYLVRAMREFYSTFVEDAGQGSYCLHRAAQ